MARRAATLLTLLIVLVAAGCGATSDRSGGDPPGTGVVERVVDGDTIRVRGGRTIRLVQVDAPEVRGSPECGGDEATRALEAALPVGTRVRLEADPASDATDRFARDLRYVIVGGDNVNLRMVRSGHAAPYFYAGTRGRVAAELLRAARTARDEGRGLWGRCPSARLKPGRGLATGPG